MTTGRWASASSIVIELDAKEHPESYRNRVVRVAGYSTFWVEPRTALRDEMISRTEQAL